MPITVAKPLLLVVACVLIDQDRRILMAQRPAGKQMAGLWEYPGGKVENGETPEEALIRELKEELSIDVTSSCLAPLSFASHSYDAFHLLMPLYICRKWNGFIVPTEGQKIGWFTPSEISDLPMPPADAPLTALIRDMI